MTRQVISVSGSTYRDLKKLSEEERDGVIDAMADGLEEPLWEVLADSWETIDLGDFGSLAEAVNALQDTLKSYLIGDPVKFAGSALGLVDLSLLEAIAERVPIPGLDRSLGEIRHYAEIAGIVLVVLAGGHILACASFKLWVHDELGQLLAKLIKTVLRELGAKPVQRPSPAEAEDDWPPPDRPDQTPPHSGPDPNPPDHHNDDQDKDSPDSGHPQPLQAAPRSGATHQPITGSPEQHRHSTRRPRRPPSSLSRTTRYPLQQRRSRRRPRKPAASCTASGPPGIGSWTWTRPVSSRPGARRESGPPVLRSSSLRGRAAGSRVGRACQAGGGPRGSRGPRGGQRTAGGRQGGGPAGRGGPVE